MLTVAQLETINAVAERLIPTDDSGPGAVEAGAVRYIERELELADGQGEGYERGISLLDDASVERFGAVFTGLLPEHQDILLDAFEHSPQEAERAFFETVRAHVLEGMFGDPQWGGNSGRAGWKLLGYPGPRREWSASDQQLDVVPTPLQGD